MFRLTYILRNRPNILYFNSASGIKSYILDVRHNTPVQTISKIESWCEHAKPGMSMKFSSSEKEMRASEIDCIAACNTEDILREVCKDITRKTGIQTLFIGMLGSKCLYRLNFGESSISTMDGEYINVESCDNNHVIVYQDTFNRTYANIPGVIAHTILLIPLEDSRNFLRYNILKTAIDYSNEQHSSNIYIPYYDNTRSIMLKTVSNNKVEFLITIKNNKTGNKISVIHGEDIGTAAFNESKVLTKDIKERLVSICNKLKADGIKVL